MRTVGNVSTLLRRNLSRGQLLGYIISNIVGLSVILIGIMFYLDSRHSSQDSASDSFFSSDYIVLSKHVEGLGFEPAAFTAEEISRLERQPWARRVGVFTSSRFAVNGSIDLGGRGLSSYMFLESVPDDFFDVRPRDWRFDPERPFVPIIISKDYLALYNFGFAMPQGMPQVSEELISVIPIRLRLSGEDGQQDFFEAGIVGFSSRLNTIAVPQAFMDWANERYAPGDTLPPSRLIVEIDRLDASGMTEYVETEGLEIGGDKSSDEGISRFLSTSSLVVTINGVIISALAVFILILSIFLLLQKSRGKLRYLMLLGYTPGDVARYYERLVVTANTLVTLVAIVAAFAMRGVWADPLADIGLGGASPIPMLIVAALYLILLTVANIIIIRRFMYKIWRDS